MPVEAWKYKIGQRVALKLSREAGEVIGRAEYADSNKDYLVRYMAGNGCQCEGWFKASALIQGSTR